MSKSLSVVKLLELAKDHNVTGEKLAQLIAYNTQAARDEAVAAFRKALAKVQAELPIIEKNERIVFRDGREGVYAPNDQIQEIVGPILRRHGFVLSFSTTYPAQGMGKVIGELAHKAGHAQTSEFEAKVDYSGGKSDTQGRGSVMQYGMRYTTVGLLNIIVRGKDDDGQSAVGEPDDTTPKPEGYALFLSRCYDGAGAGSAALGAEWGAATMELREAVSPWQWSELKAIAERADAVL